MPVIVGIVLILVAVLIIVGSELYPLISANSGYGKRLEKLNDSVSVTVYDPKTGTDPLVPGKEVALTGTDAALIRELFLSAAKKAKYAESGEELGPSDYDFRLRFRTAEGNTEFYLKNQRIYYVSDGVRSYFTPSDTEAYIRLTDRLKAVIDG